MKKNLSLKVLCTLIVVVVFLIIINSRKTPAPEVTETPISESIAQHFNDNIRDVSARLLETEKKVRVLATENKQLKEAAKSAEQRSQSQVQANDVSSEFTDTITTLKQELESLKSTVTQQAVAPEMPTSLVVKPKSVSSNKSIPYYTLPAGSDLAHTVLLSALIGEVPSEGKLMQPLFPFSALISRTDLMASNGVPLPADISGMKVNGYAIGVGSFLGNISCVRAYVTSILFTFKDGHFVTLGQEQMTSTTDLVNNESLGYLTSSFGNPCIHGKYFTNAPRVLATMLASGGIQGLGGALSQWQMSAVTNASGVTNAPTGNFLSFAGGNALSEGSVKVADWLEKRLQGSFDMVFVPASLKVHGQFHPIDVSLHLTKTIAIDKKPNGRVLHYANQENVIHDFSL